MKILFYTDSPERGGAEINLEHIINYMSGRHAVQLICAEPALFKTIDRSKVKVSKRIVGGVADLPGLISLKREIAGICPDLIVINYYAPYSCVYMSIISWLYQKHIRVCGIVNSVAAQTSKYPFMSQIRKYLAESVLNRVDALIFHSSASIDQLKSSYAITNENVSVIHCGFDRTSDISGQVSDAIKCQHGLNGHIVIGCVGRLVPEKGIETLINAFEKIRKIMSKVKLLIVGDGRMRPDYEVIAKEAKVTDDTIFAGYVNDPFAYISVCDVMIMPSEYEAFPLALGESMSMGKPVVATNVGGVPELAGEAAILVPAKDPTAMAAAVIELLKDSNKMIEIGQKAQHRIASEFTRERMCAKYENIFSRITNNG